MKICAIPIGSSAVYNTKVIIAIKEVIKFKFFFN